MKFSSISDCVVKNGCAPNANTTTQSSTLIQFCGLDKNTYTLHQESGDSSCSHLCDLYALWPGTCECPNNCYQNFNQGNCYNSSCLCNEGWAGPDCSQIRCPNYCSGNGACVHSASGDYCSCASGYSGLDCAFSDSGLNPVPFGDLLPMRPYYVNDSYGDFHPLWNVTVMATVQISINETDLIWMLDEHNADTRKRKTIPRKAQRI